MLSMLFNDISAYMYIPGSSILKTEMVNPSWTPTESTWYHSTLTAAEERLVDTAPLFN